MMEGLHGVFSLGKPRPFREPDYSSELRPANCKEINDIARTDFFMHLIFLSSSDSAVYLFFSSFRSVEQYQLSSKYQTRFQEFNRVNIMKLFEMDSY